MKGPKMNKKLNDYLAGLWDRYSDAEAQEIADNTVNSLFAVLGQLVHIIGMTDINVQDIIQDCTYYRAKRKHGQDPIKHGKQKRLVDALMLSDDPEAAAAKAMDLIGQLEGCALPDAGECNRIADKMLSEQHGD